MKTPAPPVTQPQSGRALLNIVGFLLVIAVNALSIYLPLNGKTQMELSNRYDNLFMPAGFTFSIWSIIYLFLLGFTIYQASVLFKAQHPAKDKIAAISPMFTGICLANAGWLFAWHYGLVMISVAIMFFHLLLLITIHEMLHLSMPWKPLQQKLWLDIPFSLYLGWICIATIADFTAWAVQNHWGYNIFSQSAWAIIMIIASVLISLFYILSRNNVFIGLVVIWALYGIMRKREQAGGEGAENIIWVTAFSMGLLAVAAAVQLLKHNKQPPRVVLFSQP